jgi:NitT/TauT family transport system substrate-binding protein
MKRKENTMKRFVIKVIVMVCFLNVILLISQDGICSEQLKRKVKVGFLPMSSSTPIYSDYIGAWKDEGLDVEILKFQGGPAIVEALLAGSLDAGNIGYVPMMYSVTRGLPLFCLASDGIMSRDYPYDMIMVHPDSDIKSFKDLKGKTIAIHQRGTIEDAWLSAVCEKYGMSKSDLKITLVPTPQQEGVLAQKQVDAVVAVAPYTALMQRNKHGKVLLSVCDVINYTVISTLVTSKKFANEYPETTKKLSKANIKAGRWVNDNRRLALERVLTDKKYVGFDPEIASLVNLPYWPRNGLHLMPSIWNVYYMMVKTKMISGWDNPEAKMKEYWIEPTLKYTIPGLKELGIEEDPYIYKILREPLGYLENKPETYFAPWEKEDAGVKIFKSR